MRLNEIDYSGSVPIDGYGPGFFRIGGDKVDGSVMVFPSGVKPWGGFEDTDTILAPQKRLTFCSLGPGPRLPICRALSAVRWKRPISG